MWAFTWSVFLIIAPVNATNTEGPSDTVDRQVALTYPEALVLGIVEGITEYLPISSTGHLIIVNRLLGLDGSSTVEDAAQMPSLSGAERSETTNERRSAINAYAIVIQAGAIAAVLMLYPKRIRQVFLGLAGRSHQGLRLARNLAVAFTPAAVAGLLWGKAIEERLFYPTPVGTALIAGAILMGAVEYRRRRQNRDKNKALEKGLELHELSTKAALGIGLLQCLALWPGTSRSMVTLVGGYLAGFRPLQAAEFSFLLGLVTLSAAATYKAWQSGSSMIEVLPLGPVLLGGLAATVSAAFAIKALISLLTKQGLALFVGYRICLGVTVLVFL